MEIRKLLVIIFFFLTVLIVVTLAPNIQTANTTAWTTYNGSSEKASMIGLGTIMPFGDVLIIISIMVSAGLLSMKIRSGGNITDIIAPIMLVIAVIIALNFYSTMIGSFNTLIAGAIGFAKVFYGAVLLLLYLVIIALPNSYWAGKQIQRLLKGGKSSKSASAGTTQI